jgi:hypothetical protein
MGKYMLILLWFGLVFMYQTLAKTESDKNLVVTCIVVVTVGIVILVDLGDKKQ